MTRNPCSDKFTEDKTGQWAPREQQIFIKPCLYDACIMLKDLDLSGSTFLIIILCNIFYPAPHLELRTPDYPRP